MNIRLERLAMVAALLVGWAGPVAAVDLIYAKDRTVYTGEIARVEAQDIVLKIPQGEVPLRRVDIERIVIPKPASYDAAVAALKSEKFAEAAKGLKELVDRYTPATAGLGIDVAWVQEAVLQLGEASLGQKDYPEARRAFELFRRLYPTSPKAAGTEAKLMRIMVVQKNYGPASEALSKFLTPLLARQSLSEGEEDAAAEALVLLGDCQRALDKPEAALDSYLTVVTLFNVDPDSSAEATYKAAQVFEQLKKPDRARRTYDELIKTWPRSPFVADAKKRLAALPEAHP